jgi:peptide deformylase
MYEFGGIGISACQLGIDASMFAIDTDDQVRVCINPTIDGSIIDKLVEGREGCLSFPGLELKIKRPSEILVRYRNLEGTEVVEKLDGLSARAWLHEYDHTQGICFTDRVSKLKLDIAKR